MEEVFVKGNSLPDAYHKALEKLFVYGDSVYIDNWNKNTKEVSMTMVVNKPLQEPMISKCFIGGPEELQQYVMEMLDGILDFEIEKGNWAYTYHDRYVNQLPFIIEELRKNPSSRQAIMHIRNDSDIRSHDPACLQSIQYFIRDNELHCKVLFRSNDACRATFMNAFALIMLQKRIAEELGLEVGSYTHRANSFHVYEDNYEQVKSFVQRYYICYDDDDNDDMMAYYYDDEDGWKEIMDESIPSILKKVEELKTR